MSTLIPLPPLPRIVYRWQIECDCGLTLNGCNNDVITCSKCDKSFTVTVPNRDHPFGVVTYLPPVMPC